MESSYLAHAPRLGSVGLGAVFLCPVVGALGAGSVSALSFFYALLLTAPFRRQSSCVFARMQGFREIFLEILASGWTAYCIGKLRLMFLPTFF
jgi:hypothetical protein